MHKVSVEDINNLELKERRHQFNVDPRVKAVWDAVAELEVGEGVVVKNSEWPHKGKPNTASLPTQFRKENPDFKIGVRGLADGTGFVIIRTA